MVKLLQNKTMKKIFQLRSGAIALIAPYGSATDVRAKGTTETPC